MKFGEISIRIETFELKKNAFENVVCKMAASILSTKLFASLIAGSEPNDQ